ncbi:bifunctional 4-hydroxy-2-oxoglutarate aldolase/2-dehydro-3-deoxy-phosphogluconate aldolase [Spirosoma montaniterrae]|uniref:Ketohydroxyglutarate aldolase n=1 Tax=Spirosoma montaniterrae TaxID=1178516 RepID=A0A1P9WYF4_9BACT|nr:bifunctional 4-hydroxy-2-oxoglutarate aldolase/2-dehydro-3-deoxy-phosphogluconate aldolase [Spirosoma montaniterrae]AQG80399.1 ketohydroxyglutarate aldolase [Spirosoma montaniterrae]
MTTTDQLLQAGIVPVFSHADADISVQVVRASYAGGIRVFEYTNRNASALDNFKRLVAAKADHFPDMLLGIGTIWQPEHARQFIEAGAAFVVAPGLNPAVGDVCRTQNVPWLPGCMTVSEVFQAMQAGADFVKIFPGEVVGPAFVRSVKSVLPTARLMVTGGVEPTEASLSAWFGAGVTAVGMGSQLFQKQAIAEQNWKAIEQMVSRTLTILEQIR